MKDIKYACQRGNLIELNQIYQEANIPVFNRDEDGNTPLHIAILNDKLNISEFLIKKDIFQNSKNNDGLTPLDLSIVSENPNHFALFVDKFNDEFLSGVINSKNLKNKENLTHLFSYDENVIYEDILNLSVQDPNLEKEDLIYILKEKIKEKNDTSVKEIISFFYKNHTSFFKKNLSDIIVLSIINNDYNTFDFIKNVFDLDSVILDEQNVEDLFNLANIEGIKYLHNHLKLNDITLNRAFINRGSVEILQFLLDNYDLDLNLLDKDKLLVANSSKKYLDFITKKIELDHHALFNLIIEYSYSLDNEKNAFIKNFISENREIILLKNVNNTNFLMKIIESQNYDIIKYIADNLGFMINELDNNYETALILSLIKSPVEIFELLVNHENTNLKIFDKNVNNIFHKMIKNKNDIIDYELKFNVLSSLIDDDILLLTNKEGKTPLFLLVENEMLEEIQSLIFSGVINEDNVNYPSLGKTLGNYYDINCLNVKPLKKEKSKNVMTSENLEEGVIKEDLVYLSKVLFEMDFKKARIMRVEYNGFMNKARNFETVLLLSIYNFNINGINEEEVETPLMLAIDRKDENCAMFLLSQHCEVNTDIDGITPLTIALKNDMINVIISILKKKPEFDLNLLVNTKYENFIVLSLLPKEKVIKNNLEKEKIKNGLFDKTDRIGYKINKSDSQSMIFKKELLNIIDESKSFDQLFRLCKNKNISYEVLFLGFKFFNIEFKNKDNLQFNFNDLGLTREYIKKKLKYSYFNLKKYK